MRTTLSTLNRHDPYPIYNWTKTRSKHDPCPKFDALGQPPLIIDL